MLVTILFIDFYFIGGLLVKIFVSIFGVFQQAVSKLN